LIDRNVTRTGFHNSEYAGNRRWRFLQINSDAIPGNDAALDKRVCELIAEFFQLPISECLIEKSHRFGIRASPGALGQQLM